MHIFHKWSLWVPYEERATIYICQRSAPGAGSHIPTCEVRQRRTCTICGATQDVHVKDGPMWPTGVPREARK